MLLLRAFPTVVTLRLGLWILHPSYVLGRVETTATRRQGAEADPEGPSVTGIAWAVRASSRWIPDASCLVQALAARLLLSRHGHRSTLRIGVARGEGERLEAHAWVEVDGVAVIGGEGSDRYTVLPDVADALPSIPRRFRSVSPE